MDPSTTAKAGKRFQFSLRSLSIAVILCGSMPMLFTGCVWVWPGIWLPDVFAGEMDVKRIRVNQSSSEFKLTQGFDDFYHWIVWYRDGEKTPWKRITCLEWDGDRLNPGSVEMTYDWLEDKLTINTGMPYKQRMIVRFDGSHSATFRPNIKEEWTTE